MNDLNQPISDSTSYGKIAMYSAVSPQQPSNGNSTETLEQGKWPYKKVVIRYKECLKNHAAAIGGNAVDGCREFMPAGDEGAIDALKCSACNCHRNFHRKETEPDFNPPFAAWTTMTMSLTEKPIAGREFGERTDDKNGGGEVVRRRVRTKFTKEQKGKMLNFAEKVGWKMQNVEESMVQKFCLETGIKRRVLKVWIHNNKHNYAKKNNNPSTSSLILN